PERSEDEHVGKARELNPAIGNPAAPLFNVESAFCNCNLARRIVRRSEIKLCAKLEDSGVKGAGNLAEIIGAKAVAYLVEFCMVPGVEALSTKFKATAPGLVQDEAFEQRQIPVVASRSAQRIMRSVTPRTRGRKCKRCGIEPLAGGSRIGHAANLIWTIGGIVQAIAALTTG